MASKGTPTIGDLRLAQGDLYWTEMRPWEGGRTVIVRRDAQGNSIDLTPVGFNVRSRVHEYGGGAFLVFGHSVIFSNYSDQRLYRQNGDGAPFPITPEPEFPCSTRFADGVTFPDGRTMICVRETHAESGEVTNDLAVVSLEGETAPQTLVRGHDFYSFPRLSPDGRRLAWTCWNHPQMPWDGTELWIADISNNGSLSDARIIAGGSEESVFQPEWGASGGLYFVSDRTGWWNLYAWQEGTVRALLPMEAEFASPQWVFGMSHYALMDNGEIACAYCEQGTERLGVFHPADGRLRPIDLPYSSIMRSAQVRSSGNSVYLIGSSPSRPNSVLQVDTKSGSVHSLSDSPEKDVDPACVSSPMRVSFRTEAGLEAHGLYYPPRNAEFVGPVHERPPLIVCSHGGPTARTSPAFDLKIQFWTSRGFAMLDVDYRGSSGYGRAFRRALEGQWGIADVDDCVRGALSLASGGAVDRHRMVIRGGSAGGYTTLCALTFHDVFAAGASYYGVADLGMLARDTHKFESRYLDRLVGPYPECAETYTARSPLAHAARLARPMILFQGTEDMVVPPNQTEQLVEALRANHVPFAYMLFEGEQHGFRKADTMVRCLEAELYFYSRVLAFPTGESLSSIPIENLDV
jgi:dipeptidyl aminopeptidase/acylaminoacyl peptidase